MSTTQTSKPIRQFMDFLLTFCWSSGDRRPLKIFPRQRTIYWTENLLLSSVIKRRSRNIGPRIKMSLWQFYRSSTASGSSVVIKVFCWQNIIFRSSVDRGPFTNLLRTQLLLNLICGQEIVSASSVGRKILQV